MESICDLMTSLTLSKLRYLNTGSEWDFGSEKDIIVIAFFVIINNCVRNEEEFKHQDTISEERIGNRDINHDKNIVVNKMSHF